MNSNPSGHESLEYAFPGNTACTWILDIHLKFEKTPDGALFSWRFTPDSVFRNDYTPAMTENSFFVPRRDLTNWMHFRNFIMAEALALQTELVGISDSRALSDDLRFILRKISSQQMEEIRAFLGFSLPESPSIYGATLRELEIYHNSEGIEIPADRNSSLLGEYLIFYGFEQKEDGSFWTYYCSENRMAIRPIPSTGSFPLPEAWLKSGWDSLMDRIPLFYWQHILPQFSREALRARSDVRSFLGL